MSNAQRVDALNLLVRSFLRDRGMADDMGSAWMSADVQQQVVQAVACLCLRSRPPEPRFKLQLTFGTGPSTQTLVVQKDMVYLGRNLADLRLVKDTELVTQPFANDVGVYDLHVMIKRVSPSAYMISSFAPNMTWVQVGAMYPSLLHEPESVHLPPPVVLQPGCAFLVGDHVFQVLEAPPLSVHQATFPAASPVIPRAPLPLDRPDAGDQGERDGVCVIECIAPTHSPIFKKLWTLHYMYGNTVFSVGEHEACTVRLPASAAIQSHHCSIHAIMGCFWLVAKDGPTYYHLYPTADRAFVTSERPVCMRLGTCTHVNITMKQSIKC
jgi:hypothetical protein